MSDYSIFTSESVSEGHPDKLADQISDAVLDAIISEDKFARVACETMVKTGVAIVGGEITTTAWVDLEDLVRNVIKDVGYTSSDVGYDGDTCGVINIIGKQSPDIAQGVDRQKPEDQGAGDQGLMFGYATNETDVLMPAPVTFAHRLVERQSEVRKDGTLSWLRPDAKSQVTCRYDNGKVVGIDAIVLSTQHNPDISLKDLREAVMEEIIQNVIPSELLHADTQYHINPTGNFVIGGPVGDCGLTGRKPSAWHCRRRYRSTPSAPARSAIARSSSWCVSTSTCALMRSRACSTCCTRCTAPPQPTATLAAPRWR